MDASIPTIHVQETSQPEEDVFHAIVQKLAKQQRRWRLLTHLTQQTMESYSLLYNMFNNMVLGNDWQGQDCQQGVVRSDYILAANRSTALAEQGD